MAYYESIFIVRQDVPTPQVEALATTFGEIVQKSGGTVAKTEQWGLRNLAYRIKKNKKGHYVLMNLDCPPAAVNELERNMRINEDILRYLTVKVDELESGPSAIMRRDKDEYSDRGERSFGDRGDRPRRDFGGDRGGDRGDRGPRRDFGDRGDRGPRPERTESSEAPKGE
jgi:small subunit ribosomal protein S6